MHFIITLFSILHLIDSSEAVCHACLDHLCYTKRKVFEADQISGQIAIDRSDNLLHLHYKTIKSTDYTVVVDLNFEALTFRHLPVQYSFARAVNQRTGEVYFSGSRGIYRYSTVSKQTEPFGLFRKQIWHMQFKDKLYYTEYQQKGLFYVENNRTSCVLPLSDYVIDDFIIDRYDDIYFTSYFLVYRLKKNDVRPSLFSKILYSLVTDVYDNAYFFDTNDRMLFSLNYANYSLSEVGMFEEGTLVFRMTFDSLNRIIYCDATDDKVYLLAPNYSHCSLVKIKKSRSGR